MRFPNPDMVLRRTVLDPRATQRAKLEALAAMQRPSRRLLLGLVNDPAAPRRLREKAARLYAERVHTPAPDTAARSSGPSVNQIDLDREVEMALAWRHQDAPLEISAEARQALSDLRDRSLGLIENSESTVRRLIALSRNTDSVAIRNLALKELRASARLFGETQASTLAAEHLRNIGDTQVDAAEPVTEPISRFTPEPAVQQRLPRYASHFTDDSLVVAPDQRREQGGEPTDSMKATPSRWTDPSDDPRPQFPRYRLPDPDTCRELNSQFRRATNCGLTEQERKSAENQLDQRIRSIDAATALYAVWLGRLLPWARRHPEAPIVLPHERDDPDFGAAAILSPLLPMGGGFIASEPHQHRQDESLGCNAVLAPVGAQSGL